MYATRGAVAPIAGETRRSYRRGVLVGFLALSLGLHGLLLSSAQRSPEWGVAPQGTVLHLALAVPPTPAESRPSQPDAQLSEEDSAETDAAASRRATPAHEHSSTPKDPPTARAQPVPPPAPATPTQHPDAPTERRRSAPAQPSAPTASTPTPAVHARPPAEALQQRLRQRLELSLQDHFRYPRLARRHGWEGRVEVGLRIEANGELSGVHVVRTSGHGLLDRAAVTTLVRVARLPEAVEWLHGRHFDMVLPVRYRLVDG